MKNWIPPYCLMATLCCTAFLVQAENTTTITNTKLKLKSLESKMSVLENTLHIVHHQRMTLGQELTNTEKEIGNTVRQLTLIQHQAAEKKQQIAVLKQLIDTLTQQLITQRQLLAKHIRTRYKMGEYQPMKCLLNQENPYSISRLLTFHHYLVNARQKIIQQVTATQERLHQNQEKLNQETKKLLLLEHQVQLHQAQFNQNKQSRAALAQSLDRDIQTKQQILKEYQHNKANLSQLINTLSRLAVTSRHDALMPLRKRGPKPVNTPQSSIKKMNQGLIFYAPEGTDVTAVFSGKVVFCDWLNGYGLLLILDHGGGYMTLYAHNQSLFKQKGDEVIQGEKIANVGHSGGLKKNGLYFEVRRTGKAISPIEWLS